MPVKNSRKPPAPEASRPEIAGYGLPRDKKGLLPWTWAALRLSKSRQYWIATVRPDGRPHLMLVWGLWLDDGFCFSTGSKTRKARNLESNPSCVVGSEDSEEAVIVEGIAKKLRDVAQIRAFLSRYERKYKWDMSTMAGDMLALKEPVFLVRPRLAFGFWEKKFASTATRWKFPATASK